MWSVWVRAFSRTLLVLGIWGSHTTTRYHRMVLEGGRYRILLLFCIKMCYIYVCLESYVHKNVYDFSGSVFCQSRWVRQCKWQTRINVRCSSAAHTSSAVSPWRKVRGIHLQLLCPLQGWSHCPMTDPCRKCSSCWRRALIFGYCWRILWNSQDERNFAFVLSGIHCLFLKVALSVQSRLRLWMYFPVSILQRLLVSALNKLISIFSGYYIKGFSLGFIFLYMYILLTYSYIMWGAFGALSASNEFCLKLRYINLRLWLLV